MKEGRRTRPQRRIHERGWNQKENERDKRNLQGKLLESEKKRLKQNIQQQESRHSRLLREGPPLLLPRQRWSAVAVCAVGVAGGDVATVVESEALETMGLCDGTFSGDDSQGHVA